MIYAEIVEHDDGHFIQLEGEDIFDMEDSWFSIRKEYANNMEYPRNPIHLCHRFLSRNKFIPVSETFFYKP